MEFFQKLTTTPKSCKMGMVYIFIIYKRSRNMSKTIDVAKYLIYAYEKVSNSRFETQELKLQKLMYFAQRESFALTGEELFPSDFEGWVHGPVLVELRYFFEEGYVPYNGDSSALSETDKYIIESVINKYGQYDAWYLRDLSHEETSWQNSREGLEDGERGTKLISKDDIRKDAEKVRVYDHLYDMYLDEFDDFEEETYIAG